MLSFDRRRFPDAAGSITAASVLGSVWPVRTAQAADEKSAWNVKGSYFFACPCEAICPCIVGGPPTYGWCTGPAAYHIESGHRGDETLDGLNVVRMISFTEHVSKGNWRVAYYIDERATPPQRDALSAIFSHAPGGVWEKQAGMVGEALGVKFAPITFEAEGKRRKFTVGGIADADITAIAGKDEKEILVENLSWWPFPLIAAKSSHASYKDYGVQLDVTGRNGNYSPFAFSSA